MEKYNISCITAHNGVEVLIVEDTAYKHTIFDDIMADWRKQERQERKNGTKKKWKFLHVVKSLLL